jgi:hypothetical protein
MAAKGNPAVFGDLRCTVPGIAAGKWYRLTTHYRVRVATVFHRPEKTAGPAESVASFCRLVETGAAERPDMKTMVINPRGDIVCAASKEHPIAVAEINLDEKVMQNWLGDMKGRTQRERRTELRVPELER